MLTRKRVAVGILVLLVIALLLLLAIHTIRNATRTSRLASRPAVMIHAPHNGEEIPLGMGATIHASARSPDGVSRMELWVDEVLVSMQDYQGAEPISPAVLNTSWQAVSPGEHMLLVRAVSGKGAASTATIVVEVLGDAPAAGWVRHTLQEGESIESVAEAYGVGVEGIERYNPSPAQGGPAAGDELTFPPASEDEPGEEEKDAPDSEESHFTVLEFVDLDGIPHEVPSSGNPIALRFEALGLETDRAYESLHCYIGLGNRTPLWYPDTDGDQTTDETFASLGPGVWDVGRQLSGNAGLFTMWPDDEALAFDALCVGILGGGTDAVEVGRLALNIPPAQWDGVTRSATSEGVEGGFTLDYRVGLEEMQLLELDRSMAAPYDLWIDDRRTSLRWSYERSPDQEEPMHGFLIFVNDTLVWSAGSEARESRIPDQWFYPPCGAEYEFTMRAYVQPYPDGPFSPLSEPVTISPGEFGSERCERSYAVTFTTLETGDLGGDGRYDPGDVGPVYGSFYANDRVVTFDDRMSTAPNVGVLRDAAGLVHNWTYNLEDLAWTWLSGSNTIGVDLGEGETITLGFNIIDADTGWRNEDDPVCSGELILNPNRLIAGEVIEGHIDGGPENSAGVPRCRVRYVARPLLGGPVGMGGGVLPLPWLDVEGTSVDPESGFLQLHIRNTGTAAWANQDLRVTLTRRSGEHVADIMLREMYFDPMDEPYVHTLSHGFDGIDPMSLCVTLDPDNEVLELYEHTGALLGHSRYCPNLPDLVITDAQLDAGDGSLLVSVRNLGEAALENENIELLMMYEDGSGLLLPSHPGDEVSIDTWDTVEFLWPGSQLDREKMAEGYTLTVDPNEDIFESDEGNNDFQVLPGARLRVHWSEAYLVWYPTMLIDDCSDWRIREIPQEQTVYVDVSARTPRSTRSIVSWATTQDVRWPGHEDVEWEPGTYAAEFDIAGAEQLIIDVSGELSNDSIGAETAIFLPEEDWSAASVSSSAIDCPSGSQLIRLSPTETRWFVCGSWSVTVEICQIR